MSSKENKILITGSRGVVGSVIANHLKDNNYKVVELDINSDNPIDILNDNLNPYFIGISTFIHLAANPNPFIEKEEADKNIEMVKRAIKACKKSGSLRRIINASSVNVYPYRTIERITKETILCANTAFHPEGHYGKAKIECERLFEEYCRDNHISLLNLRLGWITKNDRHPPHKEDNPHSRDLEVALKHEDLKKIMRKAVDYEGTGSYVCISKRKGLVKKDILFPL